MRPTAPYLAAEDRIRHLMRYIQGFGIWQRIEVVGQLPQVDALLIGEQLHADVIEQQVQHDGAGVIAREDHVAW